MRLLFITATRIGDAVMSTGVLNALIQENSGLRVTVACGPLAESVFASVPGLDRVIVVDKKPLGRHWIALWRETRNTRWDIVVDLRRSLMPWCVRAGRRLRLQRDDRSVHRVPFLSALIGADPPAAPHLWVTAGHVAYADRFLAGLERPVAIGPVAARPEKTWPKDRFVALARALTGKGGRLAGSPIVLIGAEGDRPVIDAMRRELQDVGGSDLIGCHDLMAVAAVLRRSAVAVVNDSGLAHLSAAAGCPTVTLFGPTRPDLYRPWGDQVVAVQAPESESGRNMAGLSLDTVENAVVELLA